MLVGARRKEPVFGAIFEGGPWFAKMLGVTALVGIVTWMLVGVCFAPAAVMAVRDLGLDKDPTVDPDVLVRRLSHLGGDTWVAAAAGVFFVVILSAFVVLRLEFARYYVVDLDHGPIAALGASWQRTRGQVLKLIAFSLLSFLVGLVGFMACCLPLFAVTAVVSVAKAMIYLAISGRAAAEPSVAG
jgi:uncharacterized membrane protein